MEILIKIELNNNKKGREEKDNLPSKRKTSSLYEEIIRALKKARIRNYGLKEIMVEGVGDPSEDNWFPIFRLGTNNGILEKIEVYHKEEGDKWFYHPDWGGEPFEVNNPLE